MTITPESYRDLAQACQMRAEERDRYFGDLLTHQAADHERREAIARMLAISWDCEVPSWDVIMVRLNECLTTFRN